MQPLGPRPTFTDGQPARWQYRAGTSAVPPLLPSAPSRATDLLPSATIFTVLQSFFTRRILFGAEHGFLLNHNTGPGLKQRAPWGLGASCEAAGRGTLGAQEGGPRAQVRGQGCSAALPSPPCVPPAPCLPSGCPGHPLSTSSPPGRAAPGLSFSSSPSAPSGLPRPGPHFPGTCLRGDWLGAQPMHREMMGASDSHALPLQLHPRASTQVPRPGPSPLASVSTPEAPALFKQEQPCLPGGWCYYF